MDRDQRQREDRGGEAGLALAEQADEQDRERDQPDAAERRRADDAHRPAAVAGAQRGGRAAVGEREDHVLGEPGDGGDGVAEQRPAGER